MNLLTLLTFLGLAPLVQIDRIVIQGDLVSREHVEVGVKNCVAQMCGAGSPLFPAALMVSGVDMTPFLYVSSGGAIGMGTSIPMAPVHAGPNGILRIDGGERFADAGRFQIAFGQYGSTNFKHGIKSRHDGAAQQSLDFLLWNPALGGPDSLPNTTSLSARSLSSKSYVSVGAGKTLPNMDLIVFGRDRFGMGAVVREREAVPASRRDMMEVSPLSAEEQAAAVERVRALAHDQDGHVVFESAHPLIRRADGFVSLDGRLNDVELAVQHLADRIERLENVEEPGK